MTFKSKSQSQTGPYSPPQAGPPSIKTPQRPKKSKPNLGMEGESAAVGSDSVGGAPASSRWNPTKEQISMLENLYKQGIRTPTAEQIQQITSRLQAFGHIEGKNVFYWFQNHKARQRQKQKQKQESLAFVNRFLSPPPSPNGWCSSSSHTHTHTHTHTHIYMHLFCIIYIVCVHR